MTESSSRSDTDPWHLLDIELNHWAQNGKQATLWWRDDDATATGRKLDQLLDLTCNTGLLLAVIPVHAQPALAQTVAGTQSVHVAQHGYAHVNHAPKGQGLGAWELGLHRGEVIVLDELLLGRECLEALFNDMFLPVVVPPWNRIAPELIPRLAERGYLGLSAFGLQEDAQSIEGFSISNGHCDPISWKSGTIFAGELKTMTQILDHLSARRLGRTHENEHTGFVTHHIDLDQDGWHFCAKLASAIDAHSGASWISPADVFRKAA